MHHVAHFDEIPGDPVDHPDTDSAA